MSMQVAFQPSNCLPMTLEGWKARAWKGRAPACLPMPGGYGGIGRQAVIAGCLVARRRADGCRTASQPRSSNGARRMTRPKHPAAPVAAAAPPPGSTASFSAFPGMRWCGVASGRAIGATGAVQPYLQH